LTIFRAGTEDLMAKLKAEIEAKAVQADVLLVADAPTFEQLKQDDLLMPYRSPEAASLLPELVDKDGYYCGTKLLSTIVAYNTLQVKSPPAGFHDLLKPDFKGKVALPDPGISGAASYNLVIFTNHPAFGWDFYNGLKDNGAVVVNGNPQAIDKIVSGELAAGMVTDFDTRAAKSKGSPIDYAWPNEGVPIITEPVAITKDARNAAAARAFVDYVLSKDGQTWAVGQNYLPGRADVPPPAGVPALKDIKILPADAQLIMNKRPEAKQQFAQLFGR
jgi:iron(III) transport system substrate-binding protein